MTVHDVRALVCVCVCMCVHSRGASMFELCGVVQGVNHATTRLLYQIQILVNRAFAAGGKFYVVVVQDAHRETCTVGVGAQSHNGLAGCGSS